MTASRRAVLIWTVVWPIVITAAKVKYLEALGFERLASTDDDTAHGAEGDLVDRLTRSHRPPSVADRPTDRALDHGATIDLTTLGGKNSEETSSSSHFVWLDSDGEWGRRMSSNVLERHPTPSDESPTLAGTVGHIDSTVELDDVWARYK